MEKECGHDLAVLLSRHPNEHGEITLLLRPDTFTPTQNFEMRIRDANYLLLPSKLIEQGDDFDCAQFAIIPQS